jgi:hypothetical protein
MFLHVMSLHSSTEPEVVTPLRLHSPRLLINAEDKQKATEDDAVDSGSDDDAFDVIQGKSKRRCSPVQVIRAWLQLNPPGKGWYCCVLCMDEVGLP